MSNNRYPSTDYSRTNCDWLLKLLGDTLILLKDTDKPVPVFPSNPYTEFLAVQPSATWTDWDLDEVIKGYNNLNNIPRKKAIAWTEYNYSRLYNQYTGEMSFVTHSQTAPVPDTDLPTGGKKGEVLTKASDQTGDYKWAAAPAPDIPQADMDTLGLVKTSTADPGGSDWIPTFADGQGALFADLRPADNLHIGGIRAEFKKYPPLARFKKITINDANYLNAAPEIVATGKSDIWQWIKFDDGTAILSGLREFTSVISGQDGAGYYSDPIGAVYYPFEFTARPVEIINSFADGAGSFTYSQNSNSNSASATYYLYRFTPAPKTLYYINYLVIGRWK